MGVLRTRGHRTALHFVGQAIASERPPHALLLSGPDGVGKTTLALDLAAGLLCLAAAPAARPCRSCVACRKIDHGNHPDLHRVAPEGVGQQIRVGSVQALAADLALLPLEGRFRIAIIEHAQRLNLDAQNALLKTLEEPPPAVVLILCADDSNGLLATVVSRCARLRLGPVPAEVIGELVADSGLADRAHGAAVARLSGGRPGAALVLARTPDAVLAQARLARSLVDLLKGDRRWRLSSVSELLDDGALLASAATGEPALDAEPDTPAAAGRGRTRSAPRRPSPAERRAAVGVVIQVWRDVARDLAVAARGGRRELQVADMLDDLEAAGRAVDPIEVAAFLSRLDTVGRALDAYANPELALDALLLAWPHTRAA